VNTTPFGQIGKSDETYGLMDSDISVGQPSKKLRSSVFHLNPAQSSFQRFLSDVDEPAVIQLGRRGEPLPPSTSPQKTHAGDPPNPAIANVAHRFASVAKLCVSFIRVAEEVVVAEFAGPAARGEARSSSANWSSNPEGARPSKLCETPSHSSQ
jgi:hypothetical protein